MDEKAKTLARVKAARERQSNPNIFNTQPKRRPQASSYRPPPAASTEVAPTANPQPTLAAAVPAAPVPAMSANQPNGQGGQSGWGANLALPGKPLGQTFPNRSTPKSEPTAEQGQAISDTSTAKSEPTPEQEANAKRNLERKLKDANERIAYDHNDLADRDETIRKQKIELASLNRDVQNLTRDKQRLENEKKEALDSQDEKLQAQQSRFDSTRAGQKKQYEEAMSENTRLKEEKWRVYQQQTSQMQEMGKALSDAQALLSLYQDGDIRDKPYRAQWLKNGQQEFEALVAENANLTAACEQLEQARLEAEQALNNVLASQAHAANFGPTNTIQQMQKMHHQNGSSSDLSDNALTRQDSQTLQQLDKIQLASSRLMDEMDSSDMDSEGDSEDERDGGEEDDNGEKTQTNIPSTAEAQPQPIVQDAVEAQKHPKLKLSVKNKYTETATQTEGQDTGRNVRQTQEYLDIKQKLKNANEKGQQKDDCIRKKDECIERRDATIKDRDASIKAKETSIQEKDQLIKAKEASIQEKDQFIKEKDASIKEKDRSIEEKDGSIKNQAETIKNQDASIENMRKEIDSLKPDTSTENDNAEYETLKKSYDNIKVANDWKRNQIILLEEKLKTASQAQGTQKKVEAELNKTKEKLKKRESELEKKDIELKEARASAENTEDLAKEDESPKAEKEKEKEKDQIVPGSEIQAAEPGEIRLWSEIWDQVGWPYFIPLLLLLLTFYFTVQSYQMRQLWLDANELTVQHVIDIQSGHASIMPAPILALFIWFENSFVEPSGR